MTGAQTEEPAGSFCLVDKVLSGALNALSAGTMGIFMQQRTSSCHTHGHVRLQDKGALKKDPALISALKKWCVLCTCLLCAWMPPFTSARNKAVFPRSRASCPTGCTNGVQGHARWSEADDI